MVSGRDSDASAPPVGALVVGELDDGLLATEDGAGAVLKRCDIATPLPWPWPERVEGVLAEVMPGRASGRAGRRQLAASATHKKGAAKGCVGGTEAPPAPAAPPPPPPEEEYGGSLEVAPDIPMKPS